MPTPLVVMALLFPLGKSHQPNQFTKSGMVRKLVSATLIALPMNVPSEAWMPSAG